MKIVSRKAITDITDTLVRPSKFHVKSNTPDDKHCEAMHLKNWTWSFVCCSIHFLKYPLFYEKLFTKNNGYISKGTVSLKIISNRAVEDFKRSHIRWEHCVEWCGTDFCRFAYEICNYSDSLFLHAQIRRKTRTKEMVHRSAFGLVLSKKFENVELISAFLKIFMCYSPTGRSVLEATVPEVLSTDWGRRP